MDGFDIRSIHLFKELASIGGEGFDVTALPLGKERVKSQGRFPRTGNASDDRDLSSGYSTRDIFKIMRFGSNDFYELFHPFIIILSF